ncbi:MAG TPA: hypothetical protein VFE30_17455 [Anaeromyxobacteraceae bacterium]|nr:hypothetical protein [Anaeromyxobacteraceae bacterium]
MIQISSNRLLLLSLGLTLAAGLGCGSATSNLQPPPVTVVTRVVTGVFLDAATRQPIAATLNVSVHDQTGALATTTVDVNGLPVSQAQVKDGVASFRIAESASLPQILTIVAGGPGYASGSTTVIVTSAAGATFKLALVNVGAPPPGVTAATPPAGTASSTGVLSTTVTLTTPVDPVTGGQATVTIPASTVLTTAGGKPLSGALTAQVESFDNVDGTSLAAFPGGLASGPGPAGTSGGVFISGGFLAVRLTDAAGDVARSSSSAITVTVPVPAGTVNPVTRLPVQAGQVVPFWRYDEGTGQWSSAGTVTLGALVNGNYLATAQVTQLGYYNVDWLQGRCAATPQLAITGAQLQPISLQMKADGGGFFEEIPLSGLGMYDVPLPDAPQGVPVTITAVFNGLPVGSLSVPDLCTGGPFSMSVAMPAIELANLYVTAVQVCSADPSKTSVLPSATAVVLPKTGGDPRILLTDISGKAGFLELLAGVPYNLSLTPFDGTSTTVSVTPAKGDNSVTVTVPVSCGITVTGTGGSGF